MKKITSTVCATLLSVALTGCGSLASQEEWITLLDTSGGLDNFTAVGDARWVVTDQGVEAKEKRQQYAFLMSKNSYRDFMLRVEVWVSDDANSGVYMRCQNPEHPTDTSCYEANIFDRRPDQTYATGGYRPRGPGPDTGAAGRRPLEYLRNNIAGSPVNREVERRNHGGGGRRPVQPGANRPAMGGGNHQVPGSED